MKCSMKAAMNAESYYHFSIEKLKIRQNLQQLFVENMVPWLFSVECFESSVSACQNKVGRVMQ